MDKRPATLLMHPPSMFGWIVLLSAAVMVTGCDAPAPAPDLPRPVTEPDPTLEADAWPRWVSAMQIEGCREAAEEVRRLVEQAQTNPAHAPQARRRLAELDVCLDRRRPSLEIDDDRIWRVELELVGPTGIEEARDDVLGCAASSRRRPDGELRARVDASGVAVSSSELEPSTSECIRSAIQEREVTAGEVRATLRAGLAYSRPCLREESSGRLPMVTQVRGPDGPIEVFLYSRGVRLTSFQTRSDAPLDGRPRAALRCPVMVDRRRPLGVLALRGDEVLGWAETELPSTPTELSVGPVRVTLSAATR